LKGNLVDLARNHEWVFRHGRRNPRIRLVQRRTRLPPHVREAWSNRFARRALKAKSQLARMAGGFNFASTEEQRPPHRSRGAAGPAAGFAGSKTRPPAARETNVG